MSGLMTNRFLAAEQCKGSGVGLEMVTEEQGPSGEPGNTHRGHHVVAILCPHVGKSLAWLGLSETASGL